MFLWDSNILRYFQAGHPTLQQHLQRVLMDKISLPAVVAFDLLPKPQLVNWIDDWPV